MPWDITSNEVALAAAAFAVPSFFELFYAILKLIGSSGKDKAQSLRPDWILFGYWAVSLITGLILMAVSIAARDGYIPYATELFLAWKGLSFVSIYTFYVVT